MSQESVLAVLRKAVGDPAFRAALKSDAKGALVGFDLTEAERAALAKIDDSVFDGPAGELEARVSRAGYIKLDGVKGDFR